MARSVGFQVGGAPVMRRLASLAYKVADKKINVLIQGQTGTGKEVLARFVHAASNRSGQPFISVNCGALPETLMESELFGHEKGAFTGAGQARRGIFELADGGTLFLDEIGDASPQIQVKLLRALETGEFIRVGGERSVRTDVRVIAATNVDLEEAVKEKSFREDLYYRLNVVRLEIPPLSSRTEDIPQLGEHFLRQYNPELRFSEAALRVLQGSSWPGNIRELANVIRRAAVLCPDTTILPEHLGQRPLAPSGASGETLSEATAGSGSDASACDVWTRYAQEGALEEMSVGELNQLLHALRGFETRLLETLRSKNAVPPAQASLKEREADNIRHALEAHHWNITQAAKALGIARNTLHRKINKMKLRASR
ncbi:sigma-54-dependent Fis family transcriptional regulator [Alkalilimnicola ehrlichii]|uniref:sigma-54 interaction domain-containing protein n=1 Tax=Alkalilimnicola ehrlichii TaxID=351052 RepID=UPI001C6DEFDD|nr:sigma-54 dependent transcriptional regulator [Alkalilimnicola ehrlichii]